MNVAAPLAAASLLLFIILASAFLWLTRPRRCPRCGGKAWVPLPHKGPFVVYCSKCSYSEDAATGEPA